MPKPQGKPFQNHYNGKGPAPRDHRRVSFKFKHNGKKGGGLSYGDKLRAHFDEEDIDMNLPPGSGGRVGRRGGKFTRSGSPPPHNSGFKRRLLEGPVGWYRVYIPFGNKYDKQFIMQTITEKIAPTPFIPIMWTNQGNNLFFYVDEYKAAEKMFNLDRQVQLPDGFKLILKVNTGTPTVDVTSTMREKMKTAMAKRYNPQTRALDMSRFHLDPELNDCFCALFKPIILLAALDIIGKNIPELEALNLDDNKIQILSHLKAMHALLPNLKILHMAKNKLRDVSQLDHIGKIPIVDLVLDGNPLCDKFTDKTTYISEVRKRLPKVIKLDGIDLPPPISFDIEEVAMPTGKQTFLCSGDAQAIVRQFLEQYYQLMDGDNRQALLQAYHENAMFSMTMGYPYGQNPKNSPWLSWYNSDNRNLLRITDTERRVKLLKQGHLQIVAFLQEMPQTKHDIHSFTVDLNIFTPTMMLLVTTGMYKELKSAHKTPPIRHFYRTFVIVPSGSGFCIANDQIYVTNATDEQSKKAFRTPIPDLVTPTPATSPVTVPPATATTSVLDDSVKHQMVQAMSQESGMNLEWSQKCLEETLWDYPRAAQAFAEAKVKGVIPPEAFVK